MAQDDGTVIEITKNAIAVKYKSGEVTRVPLGKKFGKWQGKVVPHDLITELKVGDKIKAGDPVTYNPMFFQYDWIAGTISYKQGLLGRVALVESPDTLEDGSAISKKLSDKLDTYIVHPRDIIVGFHQEILDIVKVGAEVEPDQVLFTMLDTLATASTEQLFTGESREVLNELSSKNPKADYRGKIVGIEAIYCGDVEDMTESLRAIVEKSDREKSNAAKEQGKARQDGSAPAGFRVDGTIVESNTCILRVRIESVQRMGVSSKIVNGHQMKSVTGRVWETPQLTESGQEIDVFFGYQSLQNRVVNSPELIGTTNNLMVAATLDVIKTYRGSK